jgi:phosphomannomutase
MKLDELLRRAGEWRDEDPDPHTRAEVDGLLTPVGDDGVPDVTALRDRFHTRLTFGTAGLRGAMGAGPNRMNRAVVLRATAGLAAHLADEGHAGEPVIVGHDARHNSDVFAADAAAVLAGAGHPVFLVDRLAPTPLVAFGVRHLGCCAGVQITASHNPRADNGYKVYLGDGAQIIPPADGAIETRIGEVGPLASIPRAAADDPLITRVGDELVADYVDGALEVARPRPTGGATAPRDLSIVYTPLHGVAGDVVRQVFGAAGFPPLHVVPEQAEPDPDFPTAPKPNPEEPGALDLALGLAAATDADVVLANDPDGDRLAVAVPTGGGPAGAWRVLSGDEIGVLLADWLLEQGSGADRLVVTTIVSSSMLGRLAAARGVEFAETLTGFKWIVRPGFARPDLRFVFGYEEALGSCVGTLVHDKDGISAALAFAHLVAAERARGRSVVDRLDDLARDLGVHVTGQRSIALTEGLDGDAAVDRLAAAPPATLAGRPVTEVDDLRIGGELPATDGIALRGEGVRLIVRPSGTEPKLKCYAEAVVPVAPDDDLAAARQQATAATWQILAEAVEAIAAGA